MARYEVMVLEYLRSHEPGMYDELVATESLIGYVEETVDEMYRVVGVLKDQLSKMDLYGDMSETQINAYAERMVIDRMLPGEEGGKACQVA